MDLVIYAALFGLIIPGAGFMFSARHGIGLLSLTLVTSAYTVSFGTGLLFHIVSLVAGAAYAMTHAEILRNLGEQNRLPESALESIGSGIGDILTLHVLGSPGEFLRGIGGFIGSLGSSIGLSVRMFLKWDRPLSKVAAIAAGALGGVILLFLAAPVTQTIARILGLIHVYRLTDGFALATVWGVVLGGISGFGVSMTSADKEALLRGEELRSWVEEQKSVERQSLAFRYKIRCHRCGWIGQRNLKPGEQAVCPQCDNHNPPVALCPECGSLSDFVASPAYAVIRMRGRKVDSFKCTKCGRHGDESDFDLVITDDQGRFS